MADADQDKPYIQEGEAIWTQIKDIEHQIQQAESELAQTKVEIEAKQQHLQQKHHELEAGQQKLDNLKRQFRELLQCQTPQSLADTFDSPSEDSSADTAHQIPEKPSETSKTSKPKLSNGHSNPSQTDRDPDATNGSAPDEEPKDEESNLSPNSKSSQSNGHAAPQTKATNLDSPHSDAVDFDAVNAEGSSALVEDSHGNSAYRYKGDEISVSSEQLNPKVAKTGQQPTKRTDQVPQDKVADLRSSQSLELDHAAIWSVLEHMIGSILAIAALLLGVLGIVLVLDGSRKALLLVASGLLIGIASGLLLSPSLPIQWPSLWNRIQTIRDRSRPSQPQKPKSRKPKRSRIDP